MGQNGEQGHPVPATHAFAGSYGLEDVTDEALAEMADPKDARQRVTGRLALALATPGGVTNLLQEITERSCQCLAAARRPRTGLILQLEAARLYVRDEAWGEAETLLLEVLPRVLQDGWPMLVKSVYELCLTCFEARLMPARRAVLRLYICLVCACVRACVRACVCVCVCLRLSLSLSLSLSLCVCVCVCVCSSATLCSLTSKRVCARVPRAQLQRFMLPTTIRVFMSPNKCVCFCVDVS